MKYGVSRLSIVACRVEPSDQSEMVTQLLFGEHYKIIDEREKWCNIRIGYDGYECWIDRKQTNEISAEEYNVLDDADVTCCAELVGLLENQTDKSYVPVSLGASIPCIQKGVFNVKTESYAYDGVVSDPHVKEKRKLAVEFAKMYLNAPYLWGGKSPFGVDCWGFSQLVYKLIGVKIPRDAYQQAGLGQTLSFVEESVAGDLAFFDDEEGRITHVGIVLADNYIIHASGKVRIDRLDHQGIYNVETARYSHKLRLIKSIL